MQYFVALLLAFLADLGRLLYHDVSIFLGDDAQFFYSVAVIERQK